MSRLDDIDDTDMASNVIILPLCKYIDVYQDVRILNTNQIEYFMYLKIPNSLSINSRLLDITNLDSGKVLNHCNLIYRDINKPWIRIESRLLDRSIGQHTYRLSFIHSNGIQDDVFSLYFTYIIQDDNPTKPYIYT